MYNAFGILFCISGRQKDSRNVFQRMRIDVIEKSRHALKTLSLYSFWCKAVLANDEKENETSSFGGAANVAKVTFGVLTGETP